MGFAGNSEPSFTFPTVIATREAGGGGGGSGKSDRHLALPSHRARTAATPPACSASTLELTLSLVTCTPPPHAFDDLFARCRCPARFRWSDLPCARLFPTSTLSSARGPPVANKPSHLASKRGIEDLDFYIGDEAVANSKSVLARTPPPRARARIAPPSHSELTAPRLLPV